MATLLLLLALVGSVKAAPVVDTRSEGPCDIFERGGTPCVAAHSVVRSLYRAYDGPLYQVKRLADNTTKDIPTVVARGVADSAVQDKFCKETHCVIQRIFDQSSMQNHLDVAPGGGHVHTGDRPCNASEERLTVSGAPVYAAYFHTTMGYRNDNTSGIATGDESETIYMVTSGTHFNDRCCFDYGNAETDNNSHGPGTMEAVYFGNAKGRLNHGGTGKGPWIMADLEAGLWGADVIKSNEPSINHDFVTAIVKGGSSSTHGHWAIKGGNAQSGSLTVLWDGQRPVYAPTKRWPDGTYTPMKKQGAIILGIGGDNSNGAVGTFYEGCMTKGFSSDDTDNAVQANIIAAGYAKRTAESISTGPQQVVTTAPPPPGLECDAKAVDHSKTVVAAVGDSITFGFNCGHSRGFVNVLQQLLGDEKYDVRDCGVSGTDAVRRDHGNLHHPSYWGTKAYTNSLAMKPDVVIFMLGTNDADEWGPATPGCTAGGLPCGNTSKYYVEDWQDLVKGYATLPSKPKIVTMIPPPYMNQSCAGRCPAFDGTNKEVAKACVIDCVLPGIVRNATAALGLKSPLDLLTLLGGPDHTNKTEMPGLHPSCAGYETIGRFIAATAFGIRGDH